MSGDSQTTRVELSFDSKIARALVSFPQRRNPIGTQTAALLDHGIETCRALRVPFMGFSGTAGRHTAVSFKAGAPRS